MRSTWFGAAWERIYGVKLLEFRPDFGSAVVDD
jgi:hypothetical protein